VISPMCSAAGFKRRCVAGDLIILGTRKSMMQVNISYGTHQPRLIKCSAY
jgi:hypothetical protein